MRVWLICFCSRECGGGNGFGDGRSGCFLYTILDVRIPLRCDEGI